MNETQRGDMIINSEINHSKLVEYIKVSSVNVTSKAMMFFVDCEHVCFGKHVTTFHDKNGKIVRFT